MKYITKDSGKRVDFKSGMRRDTQDNKPRFNLVYFPLLKRWAELMTRGAEKYGENNWQLANSEEELERFKESALRHMYQFLQGEIDEDHAAAVLFNVAAIVYLKDKLEQVDDKWKPIGKFPKGGVDISKMMEKLYGSKK